MNLNEVHRGITKNRKTKRLGRGTGSGQGKTAGRGHKGASSRAGHQSKLGFEGGQTVLIRRIPKRGFHNAWAVNYYTVNVGDLDGLFAAGEEITLESLRERRNFSRAFERLKVLGDGEVTKKLNVSAHRFSRTAEAKIQEAGGEAVVLAGPAPVKRPVRAKRKAATASAEVVAT